MAIYFLTLSRCVLGQSIADVLGIARLYLSPYSPNLRFIERLGKFGKKPCFPSKYYAGFSAFTHAIEDYLTHTQTTHKQALCSLLTFNFQSCTKAQSLPM